MSYATGKWQRRKSVDRVEKYLETLANSPSLDQELVHAFHLGCGDREALLRVDDLKETIRKARAYEKLVGK